MQTLVQASGVLGAWVNVPSTTGLTVYATLSSTIGGAPEPVMYSFTTGDLSQLTAPSAPAMGASPPTLYANSVPVDITYTFGSGSPQLLGPVVQTGDPALFGQVVSVSPTSAVVRYWATPAAQAGPHAGVQSLVRGVDSVYPICDPGNLDDYGACGACEPEEDLLCLPCPAPPITPYPGPSPAITGVTYSPAVAVAGSAEQITLVALPAPSAKSAFSYTACTTITADTSFTVTGSNPVSFTAGTSIVLGPGFTATAGNGTAPTFLASIVSMPPDFTLSVSGATTAIAGGPATYTVTVSPVNCFSGAVSFASAGLPSGTTASFYPTTVTGAGSTTMTVTTPAGGATGNFPISVIGTSGLLRGRRGDECAGADAFRYSPESGGDLRPRGPRGSGWPKTRNDVVPIHSQLQTGLGRRNVRRLP